jgi:hypothetical protein
LCPLKDDFPVSLAFFEDGQNLRNKSKFLSAIPIGFLSAIFPGFFPCNFHLGDLFNELKKRIKWKGRVVTRGE